MGAISTGQWPIQVVDTVNVCLVMFFPLTIVEISTVRVQAQSVMTNMGMVLSTTHCQSRASAVMAMFSGTTPLVIPLVLLRINLA